MIIKKAPPEDLFGRFREVISDPINVLIERVPQAGQVENGIVTLHNGNQVPLIGAGAYYGPYSGLLVINRGVTEPLEEYIFQEVLKQLPEAPCMMELGAYWAHYSMWLKRARPDGHCIMLEPEEAYLEAGKANFARNGFNGDFVQGFIGPDGFSIDDYMAEKGLDRLDILHVDIQGLEPYIFTSAAKLIECHKIDYLFVATHGDDTHTNVLKALEVAGYRIEAESDFGLHTTSTDGLVFATAPHVDPLLDGFQFKGRQELAVATPDELVAMLNSNVSR